MSVALLVTVALAELALRLFAPDDFLRHPFSVWPWHLTDPVLDTALLPGFDNERVAVNQMGFRGPEIDPVKRPGRIRLACLGDSSTFGITKTGKDDVDVSSYPERLRELAAEHGRDDVEVINAGVMSYTAAHGLRQLVTRVLPLEPDIVTVRFGMNDHNWAYSWRKVLEPHSRPMRWLVYRFHSWKLGELALALRSKVASPEVEDGALDRRSRLEFERHLSRFAEESRRHGFHLAFLDYPVRQMSRGRTFGGFPKEMLGAQTLGEGLAVHELFQRVVRRVAARNRIPVIETTAALRQLGEDAFTNYDMIHPSELGKRVTAEVLWRRLNELGWLAPKHELPPVTLALQ